MSSVITFMRLALRTARGGGQRGVSSGEKYARSVEIFRRGRCRSGRLVVPGDAQLAHLAADAGDVDAGVVGDLLRVAAVAGQQAAQVGRGELIDRLLEGPVEGGVAVRPFRRDG